MNKANVNISNNLSAELTLKKTWISTFHWDQSPKKVSKKSTAPIGCIYLLKSDDAIQYKKIINQTALPAQKKYLLENQRDLVYFQSDKGPVWIVRPRSKSSLHEGAFVAESDYAASRDIFGSLVSHFKAHQLARVYFEVFDVSDDLIRGAFVGLELGAYQFRSQFESESTMQLDVYVKINKKSFKKETVKKYSAEALAINSARHWVNLPPNVINPVTVAQAVKSWAWSSSMKIDIWDLARLKKENMNLLVAVGQGSETEPRFIHMQYRPRKNSKGKPIAFVGKGITFDTGGLDIKPSAGMRLMKKDMGGAAAVLALAQWVSSTNYERPCDFYLCLAENSIGGNAFRPSDLIKSRAGLIVEIDNTDAEGRLVLADGLDVAVKQKDKPEVVINVATLTGAIKVALGADIAGLFANHDGLAHELYESGQKAGDYNWRMPLVEKYFGSLGSSFADFKNSADGFGGAITAALFLQKFSANIPWAHLDIYAWADKASGAMSAPGGNGQAVQALIEYLKRKAN